MKLAYFIQCDCYREPQRSCFGTTSITRRYHSFTAILSTMPNFRKFTATDTPLTAVTDASNARVKVSSN